MPPPERRLIQESSVILEAEKKTTLHVATLTWLTFSYIIICKRGLSFASRNRSFPQHWIWEVDPGPEGPEGPEVRLLSEASDSQLHISVSRIVVRFFAKGGV